MANKFTMSVLERLEQENKSNKKQPDKEEILVLEVPQKSEVIKEQPVTKKLKLNSNNNENKLKDAKVLPQPVDLSAYISKNFQRIAKNKTFYLDEEVITALHKAAIKQKVTDSRLCNDILRGVLGL